MTAGLPFGATRLYDLSVRLGVESIDYPGDPPYRRDLIQSYAGGDGCALSQLSLTPHCGSHLDAPWHFVETGRRIDQLALTDTILPAQVVEVPSDRPAVTAAEVEGAGLAPGDAVLFRTANSARGLPTAARYTDDYVALTRDAAAACVAAGVRLVGIDYVSVDRAAAADHPVHHTLLGHDVLILEGITLAGVPAGRYTLICLPLKLAGAEASPVRAVLAATP